MMVVIHGSFPGLNEFIAANRSGHGKFNRGNAMKQAAQHEIMSQLPRWHTDKPVWIYYSFFCPNRKKDLDNISGFFHKVFQDALVERGCLNGDGWKHIKGFRDDFYLDKRNPRIEVNIVEAKE